MTIQNKTKPIKPENAKTIRRKENPARHRRAKKIKTRIHRWLLRWLRRKLNK